MDVSLGAANLVLDHAEVMIDRAMPVRSWRKPSSIFVHAKEFKACKI